MGHRGFLNHNELEPANYAAILHPSVAYMAEKRPSTQGLYNMPGGIRARDCQPYQIGGNLPNH
jgi:hypothetical protein